jgi:hypothetical protein
MVELHYYIIYFRLRKVGGGDNNSLPRSPSSDQEKVTDTVHMVNEVRQCLVVIIIYNGGTAGDGNLHRCGRPEIVAVNEKKKKDNIMY